KRGRQQAAGPFFNLLWGFCSSLWNSGQRNSTGVPDQVSGISAESKLHESLGSLALLGTVLGDEYEGTLDLVGSVLNGLLGSSYAADGNSLNGILHSRQGSVTKSVGVGSYSSDDAAGGVQLLLVLAGILYINDALEAVTGAGTSLTADENYRGV